MIENKILVVDDEEGILEVCGDTLKRLPHTQVVLEQHSEHAAARLEADDIDLLIADIFMPGLNGVELLSQARQRNQQLAALMLTAYPTVETAVECMKLGAADYITKPFLPEDLLATVRQLLGARRLQEENLLLHRRVERTCAFGEILGQSASLQKVFDHVRRAAATDFDVLITGETGTGKELVARAIHQHSRRKDGPFVPVDCGAIPEELMESEFYGHERGAFTGAQARSVGLMEFANQGTFFMDEIAQMPMRLQAKVLRALQERKIRRVGGTQEIELDARIVAASSVSLQEAMQRERFRLDLYHRLNVLRIELPPLRERVEDVPLLVRHFLKRYAQELGRGFVEASPEVMEALTGYPWPGNVRELQNVVKRMLALCSQAVLSRDDLPEDILAQGGSRPPKFGSSFSELRERHVAAFEKEHLQHLLRNCSGDVAAASREAQLPRATFYRLLGKHDLNPADYRSGDVPTN